MYDPDENNLRRVLLVGYAELVRCQLQASGVWLQEHGEREQGISWEHCTGGEMLPSSQASTAGRARGFTILSPDRQSNAISVLWYNGNGAASFSEKDDKLIRHAFSRFRHFAVAAVTVRDDAAPRLQGQASSITSASERLSPTEMRVFRYLHTDKTEMEIAQALQRSHHTIHVHVKSIYRKLRVNTRKELLLRHSMSI